VTRTQEGRVAPEWDSPTIPSNVASAMFTASDLMLSFGAVTRPSQVMVPMYSDLTRQDMNIPFSFHIFMFHSQTNTKFYFLKNKTTPNEFISLALRALGTRSTARSPHSL
jgi:hypothetical protein